MKLKCKEAEAVSHDSLNSWCVVIQLAELGSRSLLALFCSIMRIHVIMDCFYSSPILRVLYIGYISFCALLKS